MKMANYKRNLAVVSAAFLLSFSATNSLIVLQSSVNRQVGTIALSLLYVQHVVSALLLSPTAINRFGCKKMIVVGLAMHTVYILANYYPRAYTLIPAAAIMGTGSGILWPSAIYYVGDLATGLSLEKQMDKNKTTSLFYGVFYAAFNQCYVFGGACMAIIQQMIPNPAPSQPTQVYPTVHNVSAAEYFNASSLSYNTDSQIQCGLYHTLAAGERADENQMDPTVFFVLLSLFLTMNVISVVLTVFLEEVGLCSKDFSTTDKRKTKSVSQKDTALTTAQTDDLLAENDHQLKEDEEAERSNDLKILSKFAATIRLLKNDKKAGLLILFSAHYGSIQSFVSGIYSAAWITCWLGIEYVAYNTMVYGVVLSIGSATFGRLVHYTSHAKIFASIMVLETTILASMLLWQPAASETWLFFLICVGIAICQSSQSGQLASVYSRYFEDKTSRGVLLFLWDPLGSVAAFIVTSVQYPIAMVIMQMCLCVVGTLLYLAAEWIKKDESSIKKLRN